MSEGQKTGGGLVSLRILLTSFVLLSVTICSRTFGQSPSVLYTWDATGNPSPNLEAWTRNFGAGGTSATLDNLIPGTLTITETSTAAGLGLSQAFTDGANRVRESSTSASGGTDLTGLDFLEFDLGHNGAGPINVQFFVQASTGFTFVALGPDLAVTPGVNTYQVPLTGLTADQAVYIRTMGFNIRDHAADGNLVWSVNEVRSGGTPLTQRDLVTFDTGTAEGGRQGMMVNFDNAAVQGNDGGQNQTGLSHNSAGSGSVQWTDLGGSNGAAVTVGNGTALNGNTFNNRVADLSNYDTMLVRISATDPLGGGGELGFNAFVQTNNFAFQSVEGGASRNIPIDGQFHDFVFSLAGLANMNVVDQTGINIFGHPQDLTINVDLIQFNVVPEPGMMVGILAIAGLALKRRR
jgi:hypothetical protein